MSITITPTSSATQHQHEVQDATQSSPFSQVIISPSMTTTSGPIMSAFPFPPRELGPIDRPDEPLEDDEETEQPEMDEATRREYDRHSEAQAREHDGVLDMAYEDVLRRELPWYRCG